MSNSVTSKPDRSGCLSWWFLATAGLSISTIVQLLGDGTELSGSKYSLFFVAAIAIVVFTLACLYGIYQWKRWGVYGYIASTIAILLLNAAAGTATGLICVSPLIEGAILWYLVKDMWETFD